MYTLESYIKNTFPFIKDVSAKANGFTFHSINIECETGTTITPEIANEVREFLLNMLTEKTMYLFEDNIVLEYNCG